jgi:hypothetical protein
MPNHKQLKIGDRIRLLRVPEADLKQRERERREGAEQAGWTADTLERIIASNPVVTISIVDEDWSWFVAEVTRDDGTVEEHSLAVNEDEFWEFAE